MLDLALRIGDIVTAESEKGKYEEMPDHHRDTYMWLDAYRLLEKDLGEPIRSRWRKQLERHIADLARETALRQNFPSRMQDVNPGFDLKGLMTAMVNRTAPGVANSPEAAESLDSVSPQCCRAPGLDAGVTGLLLRHL